MTGDFWINEKDAYDYWGLVLSTTAVSELMTPAGQKPLVSNSSRLEHGKRVIVKNPKKSDRDVTLNLFMVADTKEQFLANYASFCEELEKGRLVIQTRYQERVVDGATTNVIYRMDYLSCTQYSEYNMGMAKISLRLNEPDPTDRGLTSKH